MGKRIYDDPSHPQYGPVRRMWVILAQLDMLDAADKYDREHSGNRSWDSWLAHLIASNPGDSESRFQRRGLKYFLERYAPQETYP